MADVCGRRGVDRVLRARLHDPHGEAAAAGVGDGGTCARATVAAHDVDGEALVDVQRRGLHLAVLYRRRLSEAPPAVLPPTTE